MSSGRSRASRSQPSTPSRDGVPASFAAKTEALFTGPRSLRSSGKKPLTVEEADCYEALSRKRRSPKVGSSKSKPVIIPDEEEGNRDKRQPSSPNPATLRGHGWRSSVDHSGLCPLVQPLAMIASGQECVVPDLNTVKGVLQQLENALKQTISIISARWGHYVDLRPFLMSYLGDVRRVGGTPLALRCDRKLIYWDGLARRAERLAFFDPYNGVSQEAKAQVQAKWEKEVADIQTELDSFTVLDCV